MSVIDRLKQARNADQIAAEIEPMCQAIAALSDEARLSVEDLRSQTAAAKNETEAVRLKLEETIKSADRAAQRTKELFVDLIKAEHEAAWDFNLKMWMLAALASLAGGAAAALALWIWLSPSQGVKDAASSWSEVVSTYNNLPQDEKRHFRQLMGWAEPKTAPRKQSSTN
jgi:hypothetical protein